MYAWRPVVLYYQCTDAASALVALSVVNKNKEEKAGLKRKRER